MVSNPRLIPFAIASSTGELADANQVLNDSSSQTGLINNSANVQIALDRVDATGLGAPIFAFSGNYAAASANISEWFNDQANRHLQGAAGQANGLRTFDLPGTTALNSVFDSLTGHGLPELYRLTISYLGGVAGASVTENRLLVRPRSSPSPQIDGRASVTLAHGDQVTFEITRSSGTLSTYNVISEGRLQGSPAGDTLDDIQLRTEIWNANDGGILPSTVLQGYAFRVANAPTDGSGRFSEVMYDGDWVVWSAATFTQWSDTANWFVIAAGDVRRLTLAGQQFLEHVGTKTVTVRGADYADSAGEIRIGLYNGTYDPGDLNNNAPIDAYSGTSDFLNATVAVRLTGTNATLSAVLPTLAMYVEDVQGVFSFIGNMSTDFTFEGNFAAESDYTLNTTYNYRAGDVLRIYVTSDSEFNTISDYQSVDNIDDGVIAELKLDSETRRKLNAQGPEYDLPPALQALDNQARVFNITHSNYRTNNAHVYLNNSFAALKNAPTTFPNTAGAFTNEITGSATSVSDPAPVTAIQDVSRLSGGTMTGAGINGARFNITLPDNNNWRCIIGGWMYYPTSLPSSYEPILQARERTSSSGSPVWRDVFGMGSGGLTFKQRATTGQTTNVGVRHSLISTTGLLVVPLSGATLGADFRVYTSGTYLVQVAGYNGGALQGGEAKDYTITAVNQDQAETTMVFDLGAGMQTVKFQYDAQRGLFSGREHELSISVDSIIAGLDEIRVDVRSASTTIAASDGNTYNDVTLSDGHAAPNRLMRYIASFRSINGGEADNLEVVVGFYGYDSNGNPTYFEENTIALSYPALDLEWDVLRYGTGSSGTGVHQNVQGMLLNPDTPLVEYPTHAAINGWLSSHDNKQNDWVWGNIHGPDQDTEAVYFPEFVTFRNLIFEDESTRTKFRASVKDNGDGTASFNLTQVT